MSNVGAFPTWTTVHGFGSIKYFNISYGVLFAIPILYELHEKAVPAISWLTDIGPFSATLKWLYAASFFYAIAIAIYQFRCPKEIKRFGESDEYVSAQYDLFYRAHPHHRLAIVLARLDPSIDREISEKLQALMKEVRDSAGNERTRAESELNELVASLHPDAVQRYLEQSYEHKNQSRPFARWSSFSLYIAGTLIVLGLLGVRSYGVLIGNQEPYMLIKTSIGASANLRLDAYTYSEREFAALEHTLRMAELDIEYSALNPDESEREGRGYSVPVTGIPRLQGVLGGQFDSRGRFSITPHPGKTYACRQLSRGGAGSGCQEFVAPDDDVALTKCAIIAGNKKWWGGVAQPGTCPAGNKLFGLFSRWF